MKKIFQKLPSPAMVVACAALLIALSGVGYAAFSLPDNSVRSRHIVNGQVKTTDLAGGAVNSAKVANDSLGGSDVNESSLDLSSEARHFVGAGGEPAFENGWANLDPDFWAPVSFYKDRLGIVHLSGVAKTDDATSGGIFTLPAGYLPCSDGNSEIFAVQNGTGTARVDVTFSNGVGASGYADNTHLSLSGISFRAC